ncbi:MAG: hypothetical protein KDB63_13775 [Nocardioidaceae bacterium]|nr:hypothetical protein [Nocardioidaceae bacterium]
MAPDAEVGTWVDARYGALLRGAHLLCGDLAEAATRVDEALGMLQSRAGSTDPADREDLVLEHLRRAVLKDTHVPVVERRWLAPPVPTTSVDDETHRRSVWAHLATLDRAERAMLVLTVHDGLDGRSAAAALGLARDDAEEALVRALREVPATAAGQPSLHWLETGLRLCAEATPIVAPDEGLIRERAAQVAGARRRRVTTVVAALVVLLVGTTFVAWLVDPEVGSPGAGVGPADPPSRAPAGTDGERQLSGVSLGEPARVGWSWGTTYVPPGGDPIEMDLPATTRVKSITPFRGGALVLENDGLNDALYLDLVGPDGGLLWRRLAAPRVVTGDEGRRVAYALYDQATGAYLLTLADATSAEQPERTWLYDQDVVPVGVLGDQVAFTRPQRVFGVWVNGARRPDLLDSLTIGMATCTARGLVGGVTAGSRGGVVEVATDRPVWESAIWVPRSFSPDCDRVLAVNRDGTGWGLLDAATGDLVIRLDLIWHAPTVSAVFEDERSVLMVIRSGQSQALVRFDPETRAIERASDVLPTTSRIQLPDQ